jgi:hypothetical protein
MIKARKVFASEEAKGPEVIKSAREAMRGRIAEEMKDTYWGIRHGVNLTPIVLLPTGKITDSAGMTSDSFLAFCAADIPRFKRLFPQTSGDILLNDKVRVW